MNISINELKEFAKKNLYKKFKMHDSQECFLAEYGKSHYDRFTAASFTEIYRLTTPLKVDPNFVNTIIKHEMCTGIYSGQEILNVLQHESNEDHTA